MVAEAVIIAVSGTTEGGKGGGGMVVDDDADVDAAGSTAGVADAVFGVVLIVVDIVRAMPGSAHTRRRATFRNLADRR